MRPLRAPTCPHTPLEESLANRGDRSVGCGVFNQGRQIRGIDKTMVEVSVGGGSDPDLLSLTQAYQPSSSTYYFQSVSLNSLK